MKKIGTLKSNKDRNSLIGTIERGGVKLHIAVLAEIYNGVVSSEYEVYVIEEDKDEKNRKSLDQKR